MMYFCVLHAIEDDAHFLFIADLIEKKNGLFMDPVVVKGSQR